MSKSQNEQVLDYLRAHAGLTSIKAIKKFGITRLAARISDLRNQGHNITTQLVSHNGKNFAYYRYKPNKLRAETGEVLFLTAGRAL